jgi:hypothetical protein
MQKLIWRHRDITQDELHVLSSEDRRGLESRLGQGGSPSGGAVGGPPRCPVSGGRVTFGPQTTAIYCARRPRARRAEMACAEETE